jgi:hypothetical protein
LVNARNIIILLVIFAAGFFAVRHFTESEEDRVKERFTLLAERAEKKGEESVVKMALRVRGVGALFADTSVIESSLYDLSGTYTPDNINTLAAAISTRFKKLSMKFYDIRVVFPEEGLSQVSLTVTLKGLSKYEGHIKETHELDVELIDLDGDWYFSRISVVEVLEK